MSGALLDTLAAEWRKLRSVRSTTYVLAAVAAGMLAGLLLAWQVASIWDGLAPGERHTLQAAPVDIISVFVSQLALAVLGALVITGEYGSGMIRTTLVAVPRRQLVLAAKAAVVAAAALVTGLVGTAVTHLGSRLIVGDRPVPPGYTSPVAEHVPVMLAAVASIVVLALVGLGLGAATRSTAGAVTTVVAIWYLVPMAAASLPEPWNERVTALTFPVLTQQLAGEVPDPLLPPLAAFAVLVAYTAAALGAGAYLLARRDA